MKAIIKHRYGGPETLELRDIDMPAVADDQVLVRLHASSVNAHDWHMLRGKPYLARLSAGLRAPHDREIGLDVAGIAEAVGANVTDIAAGDRVFGSRYGAFAEFISGKNIVPMPAGLSFEQAAAIPTAGLTALQGLRDKAHLQPGERVLVNGAGGGVGTMAVQIATALGGQVTAVTSTANVELMSSLGADEAIDYTREDFTRARGRYDVILDIGGTPSLSRMRRALAPSGRLVMVAPQPGQWIGPVVRMAGGRILSRMGGQTLGGFLASVNRDDLLVLKELVEAGQLTPVIDRTFPLAETPEAIRYLETGRVRGKVVITF